MSLRIPLMRCARILGQTSRTMAMRRPFLIQYSLPRRTLHVYPAFRTEAPNPNPSEPSAEAESYVSEGNTAGKPSQPTVKSSKAEDMEATQETQSKLGEEKQSPAEPDVPPPPPKREVHPKDRELAELKDQYLRSIAEFRNLQAQTRRDVLAAQAFTVQRFSIDLLDTIDALSHALDSNPPRPPLVTDDPNQREDILITEHRSLHEGLRIVERLLMKSLEKHGLTVIPVDEELQPGFHEVVREIEGEEKNVGKIAGVVKQGFTLNGKLIRPAQVTIYKAKTADSAAS